MKQKSLQKQAAGRQKLSVADMAEALESISEACKKGGLDEDGLSLLRMRMDTHGIRSFSELPPAPRSRSNSTAPETEALILKCSLEHPSWGCVKLSEHLKEQGVSVSSPTIQKILMRNGMGRIGERWLKVEENHILEGTPLDKAQIAMIEKYNPCFKERGVESSRPGELLGQDTIMVGTLRGEGRVYLHAVVDTYGSYAFGFLHMNKRSECAAVLLHNEVIPFYKDRGLEVKSIVTNGGPEFCGTRNHPFELYLALNNIEHQRRKVKNSFANGFIERFSKTVTDEFFRSAFFERRYGTLEAMQADFDKWLLRYNTERPHKGYRNMGKTPAEMMDGYIDER